MVDTFSGGGSGWCLAARALGIPSVGIEWARPECATRAAAGLLTIRADVASYPPEVFAGKVIGLTGSPPCQAFSKAGKRKGLGDPRGQFVYEPMRWARVIRPRWVALEQVPEVIGFWRMFAAELRTMGYWTWTGVLDAADYGVPQNRTRAILLASLDRQVQPPEPTHSETGHADLYGRSLPRWVTMAEALGWGLTERPAYTVCGGDGDGGRSQGDGGSGQRRQIAKHKAEGRWALRGNQRPWGSPDYAEVLTDRPAMPISTRGNSYKWLLRSPGRSYGTSRLADPETEAAPTVALGNNASAWCWERPATSVCASNPGIVNPSGGGPAVSMSERGYIPVAMWELGVLQGFPADHPWQPPYVSRQIGNAVPVPLALACLESVTGERRAA